MKFYFTGAESPSHRKVLLGADVKNVVINYQSLLPRLPKRRAFKLSSYFSEGTSVMLVSGTPKDADSFARSDLVDEAARYADFAAENIDAISLVAEYDVSQLSPVVIAELRNSLWSDIPSSKFLPIWHGEVPSRDVQLDQLCAQFENVAVSEDVPVQRANALVREYGIRLHGLSVSKPDVLTSVRFDSISTSAWRSPMRYGETIVWDGRRIVRYPERMKSDARRRHRTLFERAGFDPDLIAEDDANEVTRFTLWSLLQFEAMINGKTPERPEPRQSVATNGCTTPEEVGTRIEEDESDLVDQPPHSMGVEVVQRRDELIRLPVVALSQDENDRPVAAAAHRSLRLCDTCHIADRCRHFRPGSECAYEFPLELRTKDQLISFGRSLLEMQGQRVAFARLAEEINGGYPDRNLSTELDRFWSHIHALKELEDNREFFRVSVETKGRAGVISRIFGDEAGRKQLPPPYTDEQADQLLEEIVDADVVE